MKIKEIEAMTGYPRDEITYWNHERSLLKKVGKINDYDLYKSEEGEADGGDHVFVIKKAKEQAPLGELILTQSKGFLKKGKNKYWTSSVRFQPEMQGKGLAVPMYAFAIKKGYDLVSDDNQSKGSQVLWQKLSKQPGSNVYAWNMEKNKFFSWDPDEDPRAQVYGDEKEKQDIIDEYLALMRKAKSEEEREELDRDLKKELDDITPDSKDSKDIRLVATKI